MKHKNIKYDLVIVGAGLVGGSLIASLLKRKALLKNTANFNIAILDKAKAPENSLSNFDSRAIALSWSSLQLLKEMGIGISDVLENIHAVEVSEQGHFALTKIAARDFDLPCLGAVVNADTLNYRLHEHLLQESAVLGENLRMDFFREVEIKRLEKKAAFWELELTSGVHIQASLLVGADGSDSFVRKQQGVGLKRELQTQTAILVNIAIEQDHAGVAYERFLKDGTIAMLPFGAKKVKCVWIIPNKAAEHLMEEDEKTFLQTLQRAFGFRLGLLKALGKRFSYPIQASASENIYGQGWVLIGNAANTLSPVGAQGFNLGLRDASILAEELVEALVLDTDAQGMNKQRIHEEGVNEQGINEQGIKVNIAFLQKYAKRRSLDHSGIKQFTQQLELNGIKRKLGILACEFIAPLKHRIGQLGMGLQV